MSSQHDVVIIGAGPAGLAAAVYTGRARLNTLLLERGMPGGQILLTDFIENYPGFPEGVVPFELMQKFQEHAEKFGARIETDDAKEIKSKDKLWSILGNKGEYLAKAVLIATGSAYRKLGIPGEQELTGRGVSYCATCDGAFFSDKEVGIVGGGDNALTEALFLTKFCRIVKIIHRRDQLRGIKILQEKVFANKKIEVIWDSVVEKISGEEKFESIILKNVKTGKTSSIELDGLFISVGMVPNSGFVRELVEINEWGEIIVGVGMTTSQPGIFVAGDVSNACPEQMATAVGTGVSAAISIDEYISNL